MNRHPTPITPPSVALPLHLAAELQDALLVAMTDLQRLGDLLDDATARLLRRFDQASQALARLDGGIPPDPRLDPVRQGLHQALTELQFHDMATQLLGHTGQVLQACAWRLADAAMAPDDGELPAEPPPLPERPSPVACGSLAAGSVELF